MTCTSRFATQSRRRRAPRVGTPATSAAATSANRRLLMRDTSGGFTTVKRPALTTASTSAADGLPHDPATPLLPSPERARATSATRLRVARNGGAAGQLRARLHG